MKDSFSKSSHTYLLWLYASTAVLNLIGNTLPVPILVYCTKPLLMGILLLYFWQNRNPNVQVSFQKWIQIGLLFALFGDTFLMLEGEQYFLLGLSCFFVTHIAYIIAFLKYESPTAFSAPANHQRKSIYVLAILLFVFYYVGMIYFLWDKLPEALQIPVIAYSTIITAMAIVGVFFATKINENVRWILLLGIVLFVISDSCIAIDKFTNIAVPAPRFSIMFTYILAQFCIVFSGVKGLRNS